MILLLLCAYFLGFDPAPWMWLALVFGEPIFWLIFGYMSRNPYGM